MTPKEKAFELAHKFRLLEIRTSENSHIMISMADAIKCALIAVDEILKELTYTENYVEDNMGRISIYISYWQEVKQEIEEL
jgi:hypothetical protein